MGKKDGCAGLGCNNDGLFAEKYTVKDHNYFWYKASTVDLAQAPWASHNTL